MFRFHYVLTYVFIENVKFIYLLIFQNSNIFHTNIIHNIEKKLNSY